MEEAVVQEQISEVSEVSQPNQVEAAQQAPQKEEAFDITKDPRWEKDWKKDINNVYKSLKGYDKTYTPLQMAIKKYGINDPKSLESTLEEYKKLKDPENDLNKFVNYLNPVLSDEKDIQWFKETVEKKLQEIKFRGLDANLPQEFKEKYLAGQEALEKANKLEQELEVREIRASIEKSLGDIQVYAEKNNLEFNRDEFIKYCKDKNVPSHLMMDIFEAKAKPFIVNNETRKAEENLLKKQEANKRGGIVSGNKGISSAPAKENFMSGLDRILGNK